MNPNILQVLLGTREMEKGKSALDKIIRAGHSNPGNVALSDSKLLLKNLFASFLTLTLSLAIIGILLYSQMSNLASGAVLSCILLMGFVIATLGTRFVQSLKNYRHAHELGRLGLMTKGMILDKWAGELNGKIVYQVRYQYLARLNAVQIVDKDTFNQLRHKGNIFVLYLENLPHVSRLDLD